MRELKPILTALFIAAVSTCSALPVGISEEDYAVMRRLGLTPEWPFTGPADSYDTLNIDHLAERLLAHGGAVSSAQLRPDYEQSLSTNQFGAHQPKSRHERSLDHKHARSDIRPGKSQSARLAALNRFEPTLQPKFTTFLVKRKGNHLRGMVVTVPSNREVLRVLPISTRTRQSRVRALQMGTYL